MKIKFLQTSRSHYHPRGMPIKVWGIIFEILFYIYTDRYFLENGVINANRDHIFETIHFFNDETETKRRSPCAL